MHAEVAGTQRPYACYSPIASASSPLLAVASYDTCLPAGERGYMIQAY
jgi:hypothetical protein